MILQGLQVSKLALVEILGREFDRDEKVAHERLRLVKEHDIVASRLRYSDCKCETIGLHAGMTVDALIRMGGGCCDSRFHPGKGWVCPRLNGLRRLYGH